MKGIKYIAPYTDHSGYGEASRNYILALHRAGIPLTLEPRSFEPNPPLVGTEEERNILKELTNKKGIDYDLVIVHLTPDLAPGYVKAEPDKHVLSYTVWETTLLHPYWVHSCNDMKEVWVPSQFNVDGFKASGIKVPIYKIPHGISPTAFEYVAEKFSLSNVDKDNTFIFYSIFQWNFRKNPLGLLKAYFNAFSSEDNVALILKTYVGGNNNVDEKKFIKAQVAKLKSDMGLNAKYYPRVILVNGQLSSDQIKGLHLYGDAYVSLHRGEGFGLTTLEAGLAGNPVIATGATGNMEYMSADNSWPIAFQWDYVSGMSTFNKWYLGNQCWAEPNLLDASRRMREVFDNYPAALDKAAKLQAHIKSKFSWDEAVKPIISRLKQISG